MFHKNEKEKSKSNQSSEVNGNGSSGPFVSAQNSQSNGMKIHTMEDDLARIDKKNSNQERILNPDDKSPFLGEEKNDANFVSGDSKKSGKVGNNTNKNVVKNEDLKEINSRSNTPIPPYENNKSFSEKNTEEEVQKNTSDLEKEENSTDVKRKKNNNGKIFLFVIIILVLILISLGGVYYWFVLSGYNNQKKIVLEEDFSGGGDSENNGDVVDEVSEEVMYSSDSVNYLKINTETDDAEDIASELKKIKGDITGKDPTSLYEFKIQDSKGYQLAFSRFAYLFDLNFPEGVLENLGEDFSLFFYNNSGKARISLATKISENPDSVESMLKKTEDNLIDLFEPLFLDESVTKSDVSFSNGSYKDFEIRYVNLNQENDLSIDYGVIGNYIIIGSSKNSARKTIDAVMDFEDYNSSEVNDEDDNNSME